MASRTDEVVSKEGMALAEYRLGKRLGSGSFGEIYVANHFLGGVYAAKLEPVDAKYPQLLYESRLYEIFAGGEGIPRAFVSFSTSEFNVLVLEQLGPSLEDRFNFCRRRFSIKTVAMLAVQMIQRVRFVHSRYYLHRDIKPDNFLLGLGHEASKVYIIDFGLAKRYRNPKDGRHIPPRDGKQLTGTARYASINAHIGFEQARRDDIESLGYVLMYFLRGSLPWQGLKAKDKKAKYKKIMEKKMATPLKTLCAGFPPEFMNILIHARSLQFEEEPNYEFMLQQMRSLAARLNFDFDGNYDWTTRQSTASSASSTSQARQAPQPMKRNADAHGVELGLDFAVADVKPKKQRKQTTAGTRTRVTRSRSKRK